jgi:hypothetical protein
MLHLRTAIEMLNLQNARVRISKPLCGPSSTASEALPTTVMMAKLKLPTSTWKALSDRIPVGGLGHDAAP